MKWTKQISLILALLLIGGLALYLHARRLLHTTPANRPAPLTQDVNAAAGARAFQKLEGIVQDVNHAQAMRRKVLATMQRGATAPASQETQIFDYSFTQDEINAWLARIHDAEGPAWDAHVKDLAIKLDDGQLILFGTLVDLSDLEASVYFEPELDANGQLHLTIAKLRGGMLPLPQSLLDGQIAALKQTLTADLPGQQQRARITSDGLANNDAKSASLAKLTLGILDHEPVDAIFYFPLPEGQFAPVRLVGVEIEDQRLHIKVRPLEPDECQALEGKIQQPIQTAKVDSPPKS